MTREEWINRYATRIEERAGWLSANALEAANVAAEAFVFEERAAGNALAWEEPEAAADEEMSCWTNDE